MLDTIIQLLSKYGHLFLSGIYATLMFSAVAVLGGLVLGTIIMFMKKSSFSIGKFKPIAFVATAYIEILRGTPIILHLYFFYYYISDMISFIELSKTQAICVALIFNSGAYIAEILRSGIETVDKGQLEAARSLGMSEWQAMRKIIFPQAIKNILPALCNEFITMIKETSLASIFFAGDIMTQYNVIKGATFLVLEPLIIIAVIYFVLTFSLSKVVGMIERRLGAHD